MENIAIAARFRLVKHRAEAQAARYRAAMVKLEEWMSRASDGHPLYDLWEDLAIGSFEDVEWDWATTMESVRNRRIPLSDLTGDAHDERLEVVALFREILALLADSGATEASEKGGGE